MSKIDNISRNFAGSDTLQKIIELNLNKEAFIKGIDGTTAPKYKDLAEIQDSGNSDLYNQAKHDIVMKEVYSIVNISVKDKLSRQELAVKNIRNIINTFNEDMIEVKKNVPEVMTLTQACDKALSAIGVVLNSQDTDGKYLFGGVNSTDRPCGDLTTFSNLDSAGHILNNYTTATSNVKEINISDGNSIEIGIDASNKAFATLIGTLNRLKNSPNAVPSDAELNVFEDELDIAVVGLEGMQANIINNNKAIEVAELNTEAKYKRAVDILASSKFRQTTEEIVQQLIEYGRSQRVLSDIQKLNDKLSGALLNVLAAAAA